MSRRPGLSPVFCVLCSACARTDDGGGGGGTRPPSRARLFDTSYYLTQGGSGGDSILLGGTLVVAAREAAEAWCAALDGTPLAVARYTAGARERRRVAVAALVEADVVVTTYDVLRCGFNIKLDTSS
jgi:hypothetical protein